METNTCIKCSTTKDIREFEKNRNTCKACRNEYHKQKRASNPGRTKEYQIKRMYGIDLKKYNTLMATSDKCEICGSANKLCYDHNHDTGEFRGVLCHWCNSALGDLKDSISVVSNALKYLKDRGSYGDS